MFFTRFSMCMNITFTAISPYNQYTPKYTAPSFKAQAPDKFVKSGLILIENIGRSNSVMALKSMPVCDFLKALGETKLFSDSQKELKLYSDAISSSHGLQELKIKQLIGYGSSALALETECGRVLKLSRENHFPMNRPVEDFDAKVLQRGKIGKVHYYIAEKCTPCEAGQGYANIMRARIQAKGYRAYDLGEWDDFQVGFNSKCELKLLDPECAKYKTPFHKLIQVINNLLSDTV